MILMMFFFGLGKVSWECTLDKEARQIIEIKHAVLEKLSIFASGLVVLVKLKNL